MHRAQQPAVFGNAGRGCRRQTQFVAQHARDLVVHLQHGFVKERRADFAQSGDASAAGRAASFCRWLVMRSFCSAQRVDRLTAKRDADSKRAQALELCGHTKVWTVSIDAGLKTISTSSSVRLASEAIAASGLVNLRNRPALGRNRGFHRRCQRDRAA